MKKKIDYKGKYFILQDEAGESDFKVGEIDDRKITDDFLKEHIARCNYYGIPPYLGNDEKLKERIEKLNKF